MAAKAEIDHRRPVPRLLKDAANPVENGRIEQRFAAETDNRCLRCDTAETAFRGLAISCRDGRAMRAMTVLIARRDFCSLSSRYGLDLGVDFFAVIFRGFRLQ